MLFTNLFLAALTSSHPATATGAQAAPGSHSPAWQALRDGALEDAAKLPARDAEEALFLEGTTELARFHVDEAEAAWRRMKSGSRLEVELAWQLAHARKDPERIASSSKALCKLGDPTGRACVDAEFYAGRIVRGSAMRHGPTDVKIAPSMPFPLTLARIGALETGVIVDTGASQTVISKTLAEALGLATSKTAFPVGVVAGSTVASARLAVLPELWIGQTQLSTLPVLVVDMPNLDESGIGVILAPQRDLDGLAVEIDFKEHRLRIHDEAPKAAGESLEVPYLQAGFDLVVRAQVGNGKTALFSFDTGMEHAFALSREYAGGFYMKLPTPPKSGAILYGAGQQASVEKTAALPVVLGGKTIAKGEEGILTTMPEGRVFQIAGLLGNALWKESVVVLDTKRHSISLRQ